MWRFDLKTELEKMLSGEYYYTCDQEIDKNRHSYSSLKNTTQKETKTFPFTLGMGVGTEILQPFYAEFGFIKIGKNCFINTNSTFIDGGTIEIGDNVLLAPHVRLISATHPDDPRVRRMALCKKITIEDNVWIGTGATILPGVRVGKNSIVGAGSVVTKDVPEGVVVVGVPAKEIRKVQYDEKLYEEYKKIIGE